MIVSDLEIAIASPIRALQARLGRVVTEFLPATDTLQSQSPLPQLSWLHSGCLALRTLKMQF